MDGNCDSVGRRAILHYYFRLILINSFVTCRGIPTLEIVSDFPGSQAGWKVDCSAVFPTKFNYQENFIQDYTILLYQSKLCETGVAMVGNIKVWQKSNMSWQAIRWECESYEWWGRRGRIRHKFILFFSRDKYSAQLWQKILEPQILFVCKLESDQLRTGRVWPDLGRRTNTRVARQPGGLAEDEWEFCVLMNFWEPVTVAANWAGCDRCDRCDRCDCSCLTTPQECPHHTSPTPGLQFCLLAGFVGPARPAAVEIQNSRRWRGWGRACCRLGCRPLRY